MEPLIFLHIPKNGGSTFHRLLSQLYSEDAIWNVNGATMDNQSIRAFVEAPPATCDRIRLLKGHMPFGLHRYLPGNPRYVTFLRHPVSRTMSSFLYINRPASSRYELARKFNGSVSAFIESGVSPGMDNGQIRWLIDGFHDLPFGGINESHLEEAWRNLCTYFAVVGLTERFLDSVDLMAHKLQWTNVPPIVRENVRRKRTAGVSSSDKSTIEKYNSFDLELYSRASKLLERQLATEQPSSVAKEIVEKRSMTRLVLRSLKYLKINR